MRKNMKTVASHPVHAQLTQIRLWTLLGNIEFSFEVVIMSNSSRNGETILVDYVSLVTFEPGFKLDMHAHLLISQYNRDYVLKNTLA